MSRQDRIVAAALAAATLTLSRGRDGGVGSCRRAAHRRLGFRSRSVLAPRRRASVDQLGADDQDRPAALGAPVPLGVRGSPLGTGDLDVGARGRRRRGGLHVGPPARGCAHRRRRSARGDRGRPVVDVRSIRAVACRIRRRRLRRCRCVDLGVASRSRHIVGRLVGAAVGVVIVAAARASRRRTQLVARRRLPPIRRHQRREDVARVPADGVERGVVAPDGRNRLGEHRAVCGIEWDGSHSSAVNLDGTPTLTDPPLAWWTHMTDMPQVCVVITASPVESSLGTEVRTFAWRPWLVGGNSALHVDQLHALACG